MYVGTCPNCGYCPTCGRSGCAPHRPWRPRPCPPAVPYWSVSPGAAVVAARQALGV